MGTANKQVQNSILEHSKFIANPTNFIDLPEQYHNELFDMCNTGTQQKLSYQKWFHRFLYTARELNLSEVPKTIAVMEASLRYCYKEYLEFLKNEIERIENL